MFVRFYLLCHIACLLRQQFFCTLQRLSEPCVFFRQCPRPGVQVLTLFICGHQAAMKATDLRLLTLNHRQVLSSLFLPFDCWARSYLVELLLEKSGFWSKFSDLLVLFADFLVGFWQLHVLKFNLLLLWGCFRLKFSCFQRLLAKLVVELV